MCNELAAAAIMHCAVVDRVLLRAQVQAELATRVVPSAVVAKWRKELERLQPQVDEVLQVRTYLYTCHNDIIQSEFLCEKCMMHMQNRGAIVARLHGPCCIGEHAGWSTGTQYTNRC